MKKQSLIMLLLMAVLLVGGYTHTADARDSCNHILNPDASEVIWSEDYSQSTATMPCKLCGEKVPAQNNSYAVYRAATCERQGGYVCYESLTVGADTYNKERFVLKEYALGHSWDNGVTTLEATCVSSGTRLHTCTRAGCGKTKEEEIYPIPHSYQRTYVPATCNKLAYYINHCSCCGKKSMETDVTSQYGEHDYTVISVTQPTCTKNGVSVSACRVCGAQKEEAYGKATGHSYAEKRTEPTCVKTGTISRQCGVCGAAGETVTLEALGHSYQSTLQASTCTMQGYTLHRCVRCSSSYMDQYQDVLGHDYQTAEVPSTCTERGCLLHQCSRCESSYRDNYQPLLEHDYQDKVTEPTCQAEGSRKTQCYMCGDVTEEEPIPALGHAYETKKVAATCASVGYTLHKCSRCSSSYQDQQIPATGAHKWDSGVVTKRPTFTATGSKTLTCTGCKTKKTQSVAKLQRTSLKKATVTLSKSSFSYTGKAIKPTVVVKVSGVTVPASQYTLTYSANTKVGTAKVVIKAVSGSAYALDSVSKTFKITKANNPMSVSPGTKKFSVASCKKKVQSFKLKVSKAQGSVSYKTGNKKYITVKKGKVTIKKGTPAGVYSVTVTAKGNANYLSKSKTILIYVK